MTATRTVPRLTFRDYVRTMLHLSNEEIAAKTNRTIKQIREHRRIICGGTPRFWDDERDDRLRKLYAEGHSCSIIAAMMGAASRCAVIGRVHRLHLPSRSTISRKKSSYARKRMLQPPQPKNPARAINLAVLPLPPPSEYDRARLSFLDLDTHHCKWPVGDPQEAGHDKPLFCGEKRHHGLPYCPVHAQRAYQPVRTRQQVAPRVVGKEAVPA